MAISEADNSGHRLVFIVIALAWGAITVASILAVFGESSPSLISLATVALACAATLGACATIWYKKWGVILYSTSHGLLVVLPFLGFSRQSEFSVSYWFIGLLLMFLAFVYLNREKFTRTSLTSEK